MAVLDDRHLPGTETAQVFRLQQVKGTGLGSEHVGVAHPSQGQGTKPPGIAHGDHLVVHLKKQAERSLDALAGRGHGFLNGVAVHVPGNEMNNDLAVHGGLKNGSRLFQLLAQLKGVHQVSVMGDGHTQILVLNHKRLGVSNQGGPGGGHIINSRINFASNDCLCSFYLHLCIPCS